MKSIEVTRPVNAPPERVWEILTDLETAGSVISGILSIERLDGGSEFGVGTRWRETRKMMGKEATEEMEVTAIEPGRSYETKAGNAKVEYVSTMFVKPRGDGAVVGMTLAARPKTTSTKILSATLGRLFTGTTRKMIAKDLKDIADWAEAP